MYDSEGVSTSPDIITWNLKWPPSAGGSVAIDNHDVLTILTPLAVAGGNILGPTTYDAGNDQLLSRKFTEEIAATVCRRGILRT